MAEKKTVFETLNAINVNDHTEQKESGNTMLTYLSWTYAWEEIKKRYEDASYEVVMHDGLPYIYDENTGYLVTTTVTIEGITHMMWLPVMDSNNRAMKSKPYDVTFKSGKKITVAPATMFDVNKTIMRCLVKNLAMFGLGLYIYAGEDIPSPEKEELAAEKEAKERANLLREIEKVAATLKQKDIALEFVCSLYNIGDLKELDSRKCDNIMKHINEIKTRYEREKEKQGNE